MDPFFGPNFAFFPLTKMKWLWERLESSQCMQMYGSYSGVRALRQVSLHRAIQSYCKYLSRGYLEVFYKHRVSAGFIDWALSEIVYLVTSSRLPGMGWLRPPPYLSLGRLAAYKPVIAMLVRSSSVILTYLLWTPNKGEILVPHPRL